MHLAFRLLPSFALVASLCFAADGETAIFSNRSLLIWAPYEEHQEAVKKYKAMAAPYFGVSNDHVIEVPKTVSFEQVPGGSSLKNIVSEAIKKTSATGNSQIFIVIASHGCEGAVCRSEVGFPVSHSKIVDNLLSGVTECLKQGPPQSRSVVVNILCATCYSYSMKPEIERQLAAHQHSMKLNFIAAGPGDDISYRDTLFDGLKEGRKAAEKIGAWSRADLALEDAGLMKISRFVSVYGARHSETTGKITAPKFYSSYQHSPNWSAREILTLSESLNISKVGASATNREQLISSIKASPNLQTNLIPDLFQILFDDTQKELTRVHAAALLGEVEVKSSPLIKSAEKLLPMVKDPREQYLVAKALISARPEHALATDILNELVRVPGSGTGDLTKPAAELLARYGHEKLLVQHLRSNKNWFVKTQVMEAISSLPSLKEDTLKALAELAPDPEREVATRALRELVSRKQLQPSVQQELLAFADRRDLVPLDLLEAISQRKVDLSPETTSQFLERAMSPGRSSTVRGKAALIALKESAAHPSLINQIANMLASDDFSNSSAKEDLISAIVANEGRLDKASEQALHQAVSERRFGLGYSSKLRTFFDRKKIKVGLNLCAKGFGEVSIRDARTQ